MMKRRTRQIVAGVLAVMAVACTPALAADEPGGQMAWALHFSLAPTLFEPAETAGLITPFMIRHLAHYFAATILFFCAPSFVIPISTTSPGSR